MSKKSALTFTDSLGGTISLHPLLIWLGLKIIGVPHLGTRIRLYLLSQALKDLDIKHDADILDAGSGYGFTSFNLAQKNFKVIAVDSDPKRIKVAQNLSRILNIKRVEFIKASLYNLPFKDKTFDLTLCLEVLEHLKDDRRALKELARVIRNKGQLIISFPEYGADKKDFRKLKHLKPGYNIEQFKNLIEKMGFTIHKVYPYKTLIGQIILNTNFKLAQISPILTFPTFPLMYLLLIIDQYVVLGKPANFLVVLLKK